MSSNDGSRIILHQNASSRTNGWWRCSGRSSGYFATSQSTCSRTSLIRSRGTASLMMAYPLISYAKAACATLFISSLRYRCRMILRESQQFGQCGGNLSGAGARFVVFRQILGTSLPVRFSQQVANLRGDRVQVSDGTPAGRRELGGVEPLIDHCRQDQLWHPGGD